MLSVEDTAIAEVRSLESARPFAYAAVFSVTVARR